jgi:hypothetical protein
VTHWQALASHVKPQGRILGLADPRLDGVQPDQRRQPRVKLQEVLAVGRVQLALCTSDVPWQGRQLPCHEAIDMLAFLDAPNLEALLLVLLPEAPSILPHLGHDRELDYQSPHLRLNLDRARQV